jgi:hypothetical protein
MIINGAPVIDVSSSSREELQNVNKWFASHVLECCIV